MRISDWSSDVCSSDLRELGQQIGKAGEKPTVRERRRHLNSDDFQSGALLAAQPDIARGSAQPAYALSYGAGIFGPVRGERHAPTNPVEKSYAQNIFQQPDMVAHGGGREVQLVGGCLEAGRACRGFENCYSQQWRSEEQTSE